MMDLSRANSDLRADLRAEMRTMLREELSRLFADPAELRAALFARPALLPFVGGTCGSKNAGFIAKSCSSSQVDDSALYQDSFNNIFMGTGTGTAGASFEINLSGAAVLLSGSGSHVFAVADSGRSNVGRFGNETGGPFIASDQNGNALKFNMNDGSLNEKMRLTSDGKLWINTSLSGKRLTVVESGSATPMNLVAGSACVELWKDSTPSKAAAVGMATPGSSAGNDLTLSTFDGSSWSTRVTVQNSSGNVGINTTSPSEKLDIDGNAVLSGFIGLAGAPIQRSDSDGYIPCFLDSQYFDKFAGTEEIRGYQSTIRYKRTTEDASQFSDKEGWDVFGFCGAVSLEDMSLPNVGFVNTSGASVTLSSGTNFSWATSGQHININGSDYVIASVSSNSSLTLQTSAGTQSNVAYAYPNIRGQMKPFQSELYFKAKNASSPNYHVVPLTMNYNATLVQVDSSCTITEWAGLVVSSPCSGGGSASKVDTGYGIWIKNLDDSSHTLVTGNTAAIKIDGLDEYGRILFTDCSVYCPTSGVMEMTAGTAVQAASGVSFNVGGSGANANCSAGSYSVGGTAGQSVTINYAKPGGGTGTLVFTGGILTSYT